MQTIYYNGDIITMKARGDTVQALLEEDGRIRFTGPLAEAEALAPLAGKVDLHGRTLLPAFIDPHSHFSKVWEYAEMADLSGCQSFREIADTVRAFLEKRGVDQDGIVLGFGYDHNFLVEKRHPDREVLDAASAEIPIFITHASGHMGVANSKLLELAGLSDETPDPPGGRYGRKNGKLDGYAEEPHAMAALYRAVMGRLKVDVAASLEEMQNVYLSRGVTTAQDGAATVADIGFYVGLAKQDKLKMDIVAYVNCDDDPKLEAFSKYPEVNAKYCGHYKLGGCKMFLDGSPQARTAWMTKPYAGSGDDCGYPTMQDREVLDFAQRAVDGNHQLLAHCNGDAAADQYLRCYRAALKKSKNPNKNALRPVMIHCQTARDDQLDQMAEIGMIPSIFVAHTWYWGDVHLKNFGPGRGSRVSPVRAALERGLVYNFHQDTPVLPPDVLMTVWCAVNRITRGGQEIGPAQRVGVYDALKGVTIHAAYEYSEEGSKGSLEAGKRADMVILDRNPLKVPVLEIRDIRVLQTIKDGVTVYQKEA